MTPGAAGAHAGPRAPLGREFAAALNSQLARARATATSLAAHGAALAAVALLALGPCAASHAASARYCDEPAPLNAEQKDKLFRFGAIIKAELEASGSTLALVARSGLELGRFGVRYSHAGLSLKGSPGSPWSVRQLYYACDEQRPRLFDQGMAGFLLGLNDPAAGYVSVVFVPPAEAATLERAALDNAHALNMLATTYSANAFPFSATYQNCNQWVMEMLATAWGELASGADLRPRAQAWLLAQGYAPTVFELHSRPLVWFASASPWLHTDDHPAQDLEQARFRISMPASIEAFVQATVPGATRMEFCHTGTQVVIHRGWEPIAEGCQPAAGDTVVVLD